jgi:hypothetical protein
LDCCHVCKMCAFHDALKAGKQKEVRWRLRTSFCYVCFLVPFTKFLDTPRLLFSVWSVAVKLCNIEMVVIRIAV